MADNEFPTAWHREQYIRDLERELEGTRLRGDKAYEKNVLSELARLGHGAERAEKRPRAATKAQRETR